MYRTHRMTRWPAFFHARAIASAFVALAPFTSTVFRLCAPYRSEYRCRSDSKDPFSRACSQATEAIANEIGAKTIDSPRQRHDVAWLCSLVGADMRRRVACESNLR